MYSSTHMCSTLQVAPYCNNFALSISNDRFNRAKTVAHLYSHKQHNTTDLHCCVVVMKGSGSELMSQAQLHYGTRVCLLHRLQNNGCTSMYIVIRNSLSVENTQNFFLFFIFTIHTYYSSMFTCKAHVYVYITTLPHFQPTSPSLRSARGCTTSPRGTLHSAASPEVVGMQ